MEGRTAGLGGDGEEDGGREEETGRDEWAEEGSGSYSSRGSAKGAEEEDGGLGGVTEPAAGVVGTVSTATCR